MGKTMETIKGSKLFRRFALSPAGNKPSVEKTEMAIRDLVHLFARGLLEIEDVWMREVTLGRGMVEEFTIPLAQCEEKACKLEVRILDGRPLMTVSVSLRFAKGEGEGFDIVKLVEEVDLGVRDGHSLVEYFHAPPNIGSAELTVRISPTQLFGKVKVQVKLQAIFEPASLKSHEATKAQAVARGDEGSSPFKSPQSLPISLGVEESRTLTRAMSGASFGASPPSPSTPHRERFDSMGSPQGMGMRIFNQIYRSRRESSQEPPDESVIDPFVDSSDAAPVGEAPIMPVELALPPIEASATLRASSIKSRIWKFGRASTALSVLRSESARSQETSHTSSEGPKPKRSMFQFGRSRTEEIKVDNILTSGNDVIAVWSVEQRVTATARHCIIDLPHAGRYRLSLETLSPKWMVNRSLGFVATVKPIGRASRENFTLEMGSPEFLQNYSYFVVKPDEAPAQVHMSIWSHSIIKATGMSGRIDCLQGAALESVGQQAWFVPSSEGGERECGGGVGGDFQVDGEGEEVQVTHRPHFEAIHVLAVLAICMASWVHQLACITLFSLPVYNPYLPWYGKWIYIAVSIRELIFIASIVWCDLHREAVSEQLVTWHQDYNNYRRVKNLNSRAKELTNRMTKKGIWGKMKLMRSEYMRTVHVMRNGPPQTDNAGDDSLHTISGENETD